MATRADPLPPVDDPTGTPRVLVVEDEEAVRDGLVAALAITGYRVMAASAGVGLEEVLERFRPDLVLLDVYLGRGPDGFDLAPVVRAACAAPILYLTAADTVEQRLRGFEVGADDYIVKPFAVAEVLARVQAVLRRAGRLTSATIEVRDLVIDEESRMVVRAGQPIVLSVSEFDLLVALARGANTVHSKAQLLVQVWGFEGHDPNLVEVCISSLRRKLEVQGPRVIFTVRGQGYVLRR
jgi:two-component system OmpR family response regulator